MMDWFGQLEEGQRRGVVIGGVFVLLLVAVFGAWLPLEHKREALAARVEAQAGTLEWMQQARQRVLDARRQPEAEGREGRSLLALIDAVAREHELAGRLRRAEPSGDDGVRVWFEGVSFTGLAAWMEALEERYGLALAGFSIDRAGTGRVNARLTVAERGET